MSSTYKKYLDDIMNKITIGSKYNVMLIRHYHAFNFIDKENLIDINEKGNFNCVFYTFIDDKMENPFEPFLSWIKEMIEKNGLDIDNFLEEMNVYSMHKMIFKSYFSSGICKRYEHFIDHSYAFERGKIYDTIVNMINYFSNK